MTDPHNDPARVRRALLSVSDKTGIAEFAAALAERGVEIVSTGGTARLLADRGVRVVAVSDLTGFPEMLDGRVKTLHPAVHGGILHRRDDAEHIRQTAEAGIAPIDLVCIDLYPFEKTIGNPEVTLADAIEQIDIGGPAMIRSGAKNAQWVGVITSPSQYDAVLRDLDANDGALSLELKRSLAAAAFARTARYDATIAGYLEGRIAAGEDDAGLPRTLRIDLPRREILRYGENPHQHAAVYAEPVSRGGVLHAEQLHGKALSYNNLLDAQAALDLVRALAGVSSGAPSACVIKHANPCGAAVGGSLVAAVDSAIAGDPLAAFGGICGLSDRVDRTAAERLCADNAFFEVVIAPGYDEDALAMLRERWKNLRVLVAPETASASTSGSGSGSGSALRMRGLPGGMLVQTADEAAPDPATWTHAAGPAPDDALLAQAAALVTVVRALASNAVCLGGAITHASGADDRAVMLYGAGAGQMDRVASCRVAIDKAGAGAKGAIAASDAFFPFPDGPGLLIDAGVRAIVHPGGSKRDDETFALCDQHGVTCLTTGVRHFRH